MFSMKMNFRVTNHNGGKIAVLLAYMQLSKITSICTSGDISVALLGSFKLAAHVNFNLNYLITDILFALAIYHY